MFKRILVAVDASEQSARAVKVAADLADRYGADLTVEHVAAQRMTLVGAAPEAAQMSVRCFSAASRTSWAGSQIARSSRFADASKGYGGTDMRLKVRDIMTTHVVSVTADTDFQAVARLLEHHRVNQLPVLDQEHRVVGIVSEADLLAKAEWQGTPGPGWFERWLLEDELKKASASVASQMMTRDVATISPDASVTQAAHDMRFDMVKALPVVDESRRLVGIVSRADLLKTFARDDALICEEIREDVLRHTLAVDPESLHVVVIKGKVTIKGTVESRSLSEIVARLVAAVPGVVSVKSALEFSFDDSRTRTAVEPADGLDYTGPRLSR